MENKIIKLFNNNLWKIKWSSYLIIINTVLYLEELPVPPTPTPPARKLFKENRKTPQIKPKNKKEDSDEKEADITDYIGMVGIMIIVHGC